MQAFNRIKKTGIFLLVLIIASTKDCVAQFGATVSFDGSTQSIITPAGMMNNAAVFTIEFWIKTTENRSNGTYWQRPSMIGSASGGGPSGDFGITTDNGYVGIWSGLNNGGDNFYLSPTVQINNDAWHHIAVVNNGSLISLYTDGVFTGSITSGLGLSTNNAPLTIGAAGLDFSFSGNVGNCNFFHGGLMDEVRFSNNIRYTGNFTVPSAAFTTDANTVALYHLDGCVGGLVPDASANANNASPKNLGGSCTFTLPSPPTIPSNHVAALVSKAEYFYDTDPGFGNGTDISLSAANDITLNPPVNVLPLPPGAHRLYLRTKDAAGHWGHTNFKTFVIFIATPVIPATPSFNQIVKAEYFYDSDPGFGNAFNIPVTASFDATVSFAANLTGLPNGVHRVYLRTKDAGGHWSISNVATFNIIKLTPVIPAAQGISNIIKAEYYLDTDPGFGNAVNIPVTAGTDISLSNVLVNITGLTDGVHRVFFRTKDASGHWSITNTKTFSIIAASVTIPPNPVPGMITKIEYFFDHDPGFGNGTAIAVTPTTDLTAFSFTADISSLNDSTHTLFVRTFDGWGITNTKTFLKGALVPITWLSFGARAAGDSVLLDWQTTNQINADHFDIERSPDGKSFIKIGSKSATTNPGNNNYHFTDLYPLQGINYYRIKAADHDGQYKYSVILTVRFGKQTLITVYPNPANESVHILFDQPRKPNSSIVLTGSNGAILKKINTAGSLSAEISTIDLPAGVYELRIVNGNDKAITESVIVKH